MTGINKEIGKSELSKTPNKAFKFKIKEHAIHSEHIANNSIITEHIQDKAITLPKLDQELIDIIYTIADDLSHITGKGYMDYTFTIDPSFVIADGNVRCVCTASCINAFKPFTSIKFYVNDELKYTGGNTRTATTTITTDSTVTIKAEAVLNGRTIIKELQCVVKVPFYIGAGTVYTDVVNEEHRKEFYKVTRSNFDVVVGNDEHIYVIIPNSVMSHFQRVDMNGYEIPISRTVVGDYTVLESLNTYSAGTYNIDIEMDY